VLPHPRLGDAQQVPQEREIPVGGAVNVPGDGRDVLSGRDRCLRGE
jgi:hypothetical protein